MPLLHILGAVFITSGISAIAPNPLFSLFPCGVKTYIETVLFSYTK
jgi:hypothetical protein